MAKKKNTESSTMGIVVLWTFVLALTFSAGLITGQRLHRKDNLPPLASVRTAPLEEVQLPALKTKLSFYEKLTKPEDAEQPIVKNNEKIKAKVEKKKSVAVKVPEKEKKPVEKKTSEKNLAKPAEKKPDVGSPLKDIVSKVKSEVEKIGEDNDVSPAKYTLQLSSHPTKGQADRELLRLKKMGYEVHLISISIPDRGRVFRVRLGKFKSMDEARNFQGAIKKKGGISSFVTPI